MASTLVSLPDDLTDAQRQIMVDLKAMNPRHYNGRASRPLKALEARGFVEVDWDANLDQQKGRLRWRITVRPAGPYVGWRES